MQQTSHVQNIKLIPIGNSQGVRLPKKLLEKYKFSDSLLLEETEKGLLLRQKKEKKLSWEETFKAMAEEKEDWSDLEVVVDEGLSD